MVRLGLDILASTGQLFMQVYDVCAIGAMYSPKFTK